MKDKLKKEVKNKMRSIKAMLKDEEAMGICMDLMCGAGFCDRVLDCCFGLAGF